MPNVTMPDGQVVAMPDKIDVDTATKLRSLHPAKETPKEDAPAEESPTSFKNLLGAAIEPALSMASGFGNTILGGLSGTGATINKALGLTPDVDPEAMVRQFTDATYQPKTTGGQNAMKLFGAPGALLHKGAEAVNESPLAKGNPSAQAAWSTLIEGVPQALGMKLGPKVLPERSVLPGWAGGKGKGPSPEVKDLAKRGVTMTPGEIRGGLAKNIEDKLSSVPVAGEAVAQAKGKSIEGFNAAHLNDALSHIGKKLPADLKGHDAIRHADEAFDDAYNTLLPKMKGDLNSGSGASTAVAKGGAPQAAPTSLRAELDSLKALAKNLPAKQAEAVTKLVDDEIIGKFTSAGKASGRTLQDIRETLKNERNAYRRSSDPHDRKVNLAIVEAQNAIDRMIERENPKLAPEYAKLRGGYAKKEVSAQAASYKGAKGGVSTPSQFVSAVRAKDRSKDKRQFRQGRALQQKLGEAGRKVLGNAVPDSGTAGRYALMEMILGGGPALAGHPGVAAAMAAAPLLYSQPVLKALQPLMLGEKSVAPVGAAALGGGAFASPPATPDNAGNLKKALAELGVQ